MWHYLRYDGSHLNVKSLIYIFKKVYKFHGIGILNQDPLNKEIFNSLMLTNIRVGLEPYELNLM
jgi:hypothetical protein